MDNQDALNEFMEKVAPGRPTTIELAQNLVTGGNAGPRERLDITLKQEIEEPTRQESPARAHVFWDIAGFATYLTTYGTTDTVVLGDPATGQIKAVLNDIAEDGFEIVTFEAKIDPRWQVWAAHLGRTMPVKDFAKFIVTQKPLIVEPEVALLAQIFAQVRTSKHIELQSGFGADSTNGVMIDVEIRGQAPDKQLVKLPEWLMIRCPLFLGREPVEIQIDIVLDSQKDEVVVELYSGQAEIRRIEEIAQMLDEVKAALGGRFVSFGQVGHTGWKYIGK